MTSPRWLADEMVGRLARYLRFVGCDTVYARGVSDDEIILQARRERRVVVTRDRRLAERADHALLLRSPFLAEQWRAVRDAYPELPTEPRFERCTKCNGLLERVENEATDPRAPGVPWDRVRAGLPLYRCAACSHYYWEGTHTANVRARLKSWTAGTPP
ncbi:MAG TPA: Mut7-C RNAse domain-containing protein [Thermoplasmata archaeon]|nr:Mut7-C RNAse domain-containing protein [Thermoplasmata archaeon]